MPFTKKYYLSDIYRKLLKNFRCQDSEAEYYFDHSDSYRDDKLTCSSSEG